MLLFLFFALSTSLVGCQETKDAAEATGEAVEEGVDEALETPGSEEMTISNSLFANQPKPGI